MPSSLQARNTRMAISPLLATRTFRIFLISNSPYVSIAFFQMKSAYIFFIVLIADVHFNRKHYVYIILISPLYFSPKENNLFRALQNLSQKFLCKKSDGAL